LTDFDPWVPPEKLPLLVESGPFPQPLLPLVGSSGQEHSSSPFAKATGVKDSDMTKAVMISPIVLVFITHSLVDQSLQATPIQEFTYLISAR
jgi:hypothetical protein